MKNIVLSVMFFFLAYNAYTEESVLHVFYLPPNYSRDNIDDFEKAKATFLKGGEYANYLPIFIDTKREIDLGKRRDDGTSSKNYREFLLEKSHSILRGRDREKYALEFLELLSLRSILSQKESGEKSKGYISAMVVLFDGKNKEIGSFYARRPAFSINDSECSVIVSGQNVEPKKYLEFVYKIMEICGIRTSYIFEHPWPVDP